MANWIVGLLLAGGAGAWVYSKLMRSTGNNTRSSLMGAGIVGVLLFIVMIVLLNIFAK